MATVRPFKGLRPPPELAAKVAALPYDVMNSEEARVMASGNPMSLLHITKPEIDLDPSIDLYDPRVYAKARENFDRFCAQGWLRDDPAPYFYVYRQVMHGRAQTGLMAACSADDYWADVIKKHELTRADKEEDRLKHVDVIDANAGPVFLTYRDQAEIDRRIAEITSQPPAVDFTADDGIRHVLWVVTDPTWIDAVRRLFAAVPVLYVADGHHRSAAAARIRNLRRDQNPKHTGEEEYNFFLAVLFPASHLKILDYNRVVTDLNGMSADTFMAKVSEKFEVSPTTEKSPPAQKRFGMYLGGRWYQLVARPGTFAADDVIASLDVSILQNNLLAPLLGINDPRKDKRIDFVGGIRGVGELEKLVDSGKFAVAFAMHPTTIEQLMAIADAGKIMPPKSTWFEPKLRSGMVIHRLT